MSRASAQQVHYETAVPSNKCNYSMLISECLATLCHLGDLRPRGRPACARSPKKYRWCSHGGHRTDSAEPRRPMTRNEFRHFWGRDVTFLAVVCEFYDSMFRGGNAILRKLADRSSATLIACFRRSITALIACSKNCKPFLGREPSNAIPQRV